MACRNANKSSNLTIAVDSTDKISSQILLSQKPPYFFILPSDTNSLNYQLLIVLDPHGDGKNAAQRFAFVARRYPCAVIGLNEVKNNTLNFETLISKAVSDVLSRFQFKFDKVFIVGFSGGARMAYQYSEKHQISGLILCGAGPGRIPEKLDFPLVMIAGLQDFNFTEQYYNASSNLMQNHSVIAFAFSGKHEWPDTTALSVAVDFVFKKSGFLAKIEKNSDFLQMAKKYETQGRYFLALKMLEVAVKTDNQYLRNENQQALSKLIKTEKYNKYMTQFEQNLTKESDRNRNYVKNIDIKDFAWWKSEIIRIDKKTKEKNEIIADAYARNKGFLGILMYSKINNLYNTSDTLFLDKYLKIYEQLEPKNPDLFFFKARQAYLKNENEDCKKYLNQAKNMGFSDTLKINSVFPSNFSQ